MRKHNTAGAHAARAVAAPRCLPRTFARCKPWSLPPSPCPPPTTHTRAAMTLPVPDTEFYLRCIRKCRAVAESERSADVRALLESHELIEAAVEAVPTPRPDGAAAPAPEVRAVAVARALRAYVLCDGILVHPVALTAWFLDSEPAFTADGGILVYEVDLDAFEQPFPPLGDEGAVAALGVLLRTMVSLVRLPQYEKDLESKSRQHALLSVCLEKLDTAPEGAVDEALEQLAAAAGSSGPQLPSATELRMACLIPLVLVHGPQRLEGDLLIECSLAAERLLQLAPDLPRAILTAAELELNFERYDRALPLYRRAFEAARQQRDDNCTASAGFDLVMHMRRWRDLAMDQVRVEGGLPRPSELLAVLREANAACERYRGLLPILWTSSPDGALGLAALVEEPLRLMVELQGDSLHAPGDSVMRVTLAVWKAYFDIKAAVDNNLSKGEPVRCSGCGHDATTLRKCSACKQAQYCRCAHCCHACTSLLPAACLLTPPNHAPLPHHPAAAASAKRRTGRHTRRRARQPSAASRAAEWGPSLLARVRGARSCSR